MKKTTSIKNYAKRYHKQVGMTLIELTVVLLILIGLAGLLVPYVGSFNQTTHDSTNSNNLAQLNNAIGRYIAEKNEFPKHVDTLTNAMGGTGGSGSCSGSQSAGAIYCGLANTGLFSSTPVQYASGSIGAQSLAKSGIKMAVGHNPNVANKTFGTSTGMYGLMMASSSGWGTGTTTGMSNVAFAAVTGVSGVGTGGSAGTVEGHLAYVLGRDPMVYNSTCYDFIAVGIGDNNEAVQHTMASAPVNFPESGDLTPNDIYSHYVAILQVHKDNTSSGCPAIVEKAKYLGVAAVVPKSESSTLVGVNNQIQKGWENRT